LSPPCVERLRAATDWKTNEQLPLSDFLVRSSGQEIKTVEHKERPPIRERLVRKSQLIQHEMQAPDRWLIRFTPYALLHLKTRE
jgi:hypothetical protein